MRRVRQHAAENTHNQDRWLLTYADMITLLTAFFMMLYAMSVTNKGKFTQVATSMRTGFTGVSGGGTGVLPGAGAPVDHLGRATNEIRDYSEAMRNLRQYVEQNKLTDSVSTRPDERGTVISLIADNMLFERGKADLRSVNAPVLVRVAQVLRSTVNRVAIEGHTCNLPIQTAQFPSNWELSGARAGALVRYFTDQQRLPSGRFIQSGLADTRPIALNDSEANRARNRRVDIVILKTEAQREIDLALRSEIRRITVSGISDTSSAAAGGDINQ